MTALILAAGYATRLYPLTKDFPKPLLPVGDSTIIDRLIEDLKDAVDRFVVVTNHRFAPIFERWAQGRPALEIVDDGTSSNDTRLGAVRDILFAVRKLGLEDDLFVMAGDNVLDFSLVPFLASARASGTSCVMCHPEDRIEALRKTAVITVDGDWGITSYEEKPAEPKGCLAVPPFYFYRAADAALIPQALREGCGSDAPGSFAAWLSGRAAVHAWKMPGARYDVGDLAGYEAVRRRFAKEHRP